MRNSSRIVLVVSESVILFIINATIDDVYALERMEGLRLNDLRYPREMVDLRNKD